MHAPKDSLGEPSMHFLSGKHIAIAGAGIASLSFILALDRAWPPHSPRPSVTIYERRPRQPDNDQEGYSISIRSDKRSGGLQVLRKLGVLDDVLDASITGLNGGRGGFCMWDANFKRVLKVRQPEVPPNGLPVNTVRVARWVLREKLIEALPEWVEVRWGVGCEGAEVLDPGRVAVKLSDGGCAECDLLIAADGANSRIRAAMQPDDRLEFAGAVCIAATARMPDGLPEIVKEDHGVAVGGDGHSLFVSPVDQHSAVWSVGYLAPGPRTPVRGEDAVRQADDILDEALERGKVFSEPFNTLVNATDPKTLMIFNAMDKQPIEHSQLPTRNVVFIGDANHAVSPFAGNGANMALIDGVDLAENLVMAVDIVSVVKAFDAKSMPRSKGAIQQSHFAIRVGHSRGWAWWFWTWVLHLVNWFVV